MWFLYLLPVALALHTREPPAPAPLARADGVVEGWMHARLNHFVASNTDTFPMRYFYNPALANSSNVVIFVGGEWAISPGWVQGGLPYELAEALQAGLFYTEHRYYGNTRPSNDTSVEDLRYLTVDQALADVAQFIDYITSDQFEGGRYQNGTVTVAGCSYAGSMATWLRLAYPHQVHSALSDSGPLHAQEDFPEYVEMITTAIREQGSEECVDSIEDAMSELLNLVNTTNGAAQVSNMFNTCASLSPTSLMDHATFFWFGITEVFAYLTQYALPGQIPAACAVLTNTTVAPSPVQRLANWVTSQAYAQPCIEARYSEVVAAHLNVSYDAPQATMRLWTYQTCVEYGWYQTTSGSQQPFFNAVPIEYFHQMCKDFFGQHFDEARLRNGIRRTNLLFAGLTHLPDYVVSVVGGHDPWAPMGPNATHATEKAPVFVVPQASHCRGLGSLGSTTDQELESIKSQVLNRLYYQIKGEDLIVSFAPHLTASLLVVAISVLLVA